MAHFLIHSEYTQSGLASFRRLQGNIRDGF